MSALENGESVITKSIGSDIDHLLEQIDIDIKRGNALKKYLSQLQKAFEQPDIEKLNKLLASEARSRLITSYPTATNLIDKLVIHVRRTSEVGLSSLMDRFQEHCNSQGIGIRGRLPRFSINNLLDVELDETRRTAKIGTIFLKTMDWDKIRAAIERERQRIWKRDFDAAKFRDELLDVHSEVLKVKPNPTGWVRLEDVYQTLKKRMQASNPNWKAGGRLVAYFKDEFSADLSKLWQAQTSKSIDFPHIELSGIRDPRLSYKVVLPSDQVGLYGHMRPEKKVT